MVPSTSSMKCTLKPRKSCSTWKTPTARAVHVEVNDKLVHHRLQQRQIPAAAADFFNLLRASIPPCAGRSDWEFPVPCFRHGKPSQPDCSIRSEPALHAIRVITAGIHPQHDARAGVEKLAGGDNFIAPARCGFRSRRRETAATRANGECCQQKRECAQWRKFSVCLKHPFNRVEKLHGAAA